MQTRIKICCISSKEEAQLAVRAGVHALGFVSEMPSGPGVIQEELIVALTKSIPPGVASFLLTSKQHAPEIIAQQQRLGANTLQLVDSVSPATRTALRNALPGIKIVQVIHVIEDVSLEKALLAAETSDALLLDSGNPNAAIKTLGGTGETHNWQISSKIVEQTNLPVFLAGGLNSSNVREAIETVQPYGVDICSGVRTNGNLDPVKLDSFVAKVLG